MGALLHHSVLIPWLLGMVFGIFVGATPGLTATMAVALIVPISFHLEPTAGLAMIVGVSFTAIFAGDIPATYLRIPGTPASAAAVLDGHEMAKQGRGALALTLDLFCSSLGGLIGVALLITVAPLLAQFALQFSFYERFWLAVFGLSLSALVSAGSTTKGLMAACLGMLLSTVGIDVVSGVPRYTFGSIPMMRGLDFIPVMIGLFGLSEVFRHVSRPLGTLRETVVSGRGALPILEACRVIWQQKFVVLRSSVVGTIIGALPGAGADIAAWVAYGLAQKTSRRGSLFGTGVVEGVVAPTSANNAAVAGAWIPALVFGVPGDAVTAIVLGALMMYDIKPGPRIFDESGDQMNSLFAVALLTQVLLLIAGLAGIKAFGAILRLPRSIVLTAVVVFSVVGSYALNNSLFDVYVMLIFGVVGYLLESQRVPLAPLILGLILGPMVEENLRVGLISSDGSFAPFFTSPICAVLVALLLLTYIGLPVMRVLLRKTRKVSMRGITMGCLLLTGAVLTFCLSQGWAEESSGVLLPACTEKLPISRDLTQTDPQAGLPDGGAACCGPVAMSNSFFALASLGYPALIPGRERQDEAHWELARTLAGDGYTAAGSRRGTNVQRMIRGADRYVSERGYSARFEFQGWRTVADEHSRGKYPDPRWIAENLPGPRAVWFNIGWYRYDRATDTYHRQGGHWVTAVGCGVDSEGNADSNILIVYDPSPRSGYQPRADYVRWQHLDGGQLAGPDWVPRKPGFAGGLLRLSGGLEINRRKGDTALLDGVLVMTLEPHSKTGCSAGEDGPTRHGNGS